MMLRVTRIFGFGFLLVATACFAQPVLTVSDMGLNGSSNREWLVQATPDGGLFTNTVNGFGGSLAVELAFEVTGSGLVGATKNGADWPFDNPGNNPFTSGITFGIQSDLGNDTLFTALGSDFFTSSVPVDVITIETVGSGMTTLSWGGHTLLPGSADQFVGSRLAQGGTNFDNYMGSLTVGGGVMCDFDGDGSCGCNDIDMLTAEVVAGTNGSSFDLNGDGSVNIMDRDQWLADAGAINLASGNSYLIGDANLDGSVDVSDFNIWNGNKFTSNPAWCSGDFNADGSVDVSDFNAWNGNKFNTADVSAVPEPANMALLMLGFMGLLPVLRRRR